MVHFTNQFKISNWPPVFILNLKYWYLSKMILFLKCPLVSTFLLLIKARRYYFSAFLSTFNSDIQKSRKNEMKRYENETLCWIMIQGWVTWKWSLAFNNDDGKKTVQAKPTPPTAFSLCPYTVPWNGNQKKINGNYSTTNLEHLKFVDWFNS